MPAKLTPPNRRATAGGPRAPVPLSMPPETHPRRSWYLAIFLGTFLGTVPPLTTSSVHSLLWIMWKTEAKEGAMPVWPRPLVDYDCPRTPLATSHGSSARHPRAASRYRPRWRARRGWESVGAETLTGSPLGNPGVSLGNPGQPPGQPAGPSTGRGDDLAPRQEPRSHRKFRAAAFNPGFSRAGAPSYCLQSGSAASWRQGSPKDPRRKPPPGRQTPVQPALSRTPTCSSRSCRVRHCVQLSRTPCPRLLCCARNPLSPFFTGNAFFAGPAFQPSAPFPHLWICLWITLINPSKTPTITPEIGGISAVSH